MDSLQRLTAPDGHEIRVRIWQPPGEAAGVIQLLHGLGEHVNRYDRFAHAAGERGFVLCAHNHRGHGDHTRETGYFADNKGWHLVVDDARIVLTHIQERFAELPIVMLGHSMGSYVAQNFAMHYGARLAGLLLSASTWPQRAKLLPAMLIARIESLRRGRRHSQMHSCVPATCAWCLEGCPPCICLLCFRTSLLPGSGSQSMRAAMLHQQIDDPALWATLPRLVPDKESVR